MFTFLLIKLVFYIVHTFLPCFPKKFKNAPQTNRYQMLIHEAYYFNRVKTLLDD